MVEGVVGLKVKAKEQKTCGTLQSATSQGLWSHNKSFACLKERGGGRRRRRNGKATNCIHWIQRKQVEACFTFFSLAGDLTEPWFCNGNEDSNPWFDLELFSFLWSMKLIPPTGWMQVHLELVLFSVEAFQSTPRRLFYAGTSLFCAAIQMLAITTPHHHTNLVLPKQILDSWTVCVTCSSNACF